MDIDMLNRINVQSLWTGSFITGFTVLILLALTWNNYDITEHTAPAPILIAGNRFEQVDVQIKTPENTTLKTDEVTEIRMCSMSQRKKHIQKMCKELNITTTKFQGTFVVDDIHKVAFCKVPKTASTTWTGLLKMSQPNAEQLKDKYRSNHLEWQLLKYGIRFVNNVSEIADYTKFVSVRNPHTRLVSAYWNKFGSDNDKNFASKRKELLALERQHQGNASQPEREYPSFEAFIRHLVFSEDNEHWQAYTEQCNPCTHHVTFDYVLKVETMARDSNYIMPRLRLKPDALKTFTRNFHDYRYGKSQTRFAKTLDKLKVLEDSQLEKIREKYKVDDQLFGYTYDVDSATAGCGIVTDDGHVCC